MGTHGGIVLDLAANGNVMEFEYSKVPGQLGESQAIVGFRDSMALVSGLVGGPWVGLGVGFLAGLERWSLGGFVAVASGVATLCLGLGAGLYRHFQPSRATALRGVVLVVLVGTLAQRALILALAPADLRVLVLSLEIIVPVAALNLLGCTLFLWIMVDLDRERLGLLKLKQAKIDAHFLNSALSTIEAEMGRNSAAAQAALLQLARYFDRIHAFIEAEKITLGQELEHLDHYLAIQQFRFEENLILDKQISPSLSGALVPPRCLLTLVENAFDHGYPGGKRPFRLSLSARPSALGMELEVRDNGPGMAPERCAELGNAPVVSASRFGSGTALYTLAQSLELAFGSRARLSFISKPGEGTVARLTLPGAAR